MTRIRLFSNEDFTLSQIAKNEYDELKLFVTVENVI